MNSSSFLFEPSMPPLQQQQIQVPQQHPSYDPMHSHTPPDLPPLPPSQPSSSGSGSGGGGKKGEGVYYATLTLMTALPTGIVEALMHYVAIKSGPRAAVVSLSSLVSSIAALYVARAAVNSSEKVPTKRIIVTSVTTAVVTLLSSALVSRLDSRVRGAAVSSIVVGLVAGLAASGGELLSSVKK